MTKQEQKAARQAMVMAMYRLGWAIEAVAIWKLTPTAKLHADDAASELIGIRIWGDYTLAQYRGIGYAAHRNRGAYSSTMTHRVIYTRIIADARIDKGPRSASMQVGDIFDAAPACGCTQGQHAAHPIFKAGQTVACSRCSK